MTTYQEYEQQFVSDLVKAAPTPIEPPLRALLNALPYYGSMAWSAAHRGALLNILQTNLPNERIAAQPSESGINVRSSYGYAGPYSGYRDAFYTGIVSTAAAETVLKLAQDATVGLGRGYWESYSIALLTDSVRQKVSVSLNIDDLTSTLTYCNQLLMPALSATYLGVYESGYAPTATAYRAIIDAGQKEAAQSQLNDAIRSGYFTANINLAIGTSASTNAATWFLFNLWITLKALGNQDVDAAIRSYQDPRVGLDVPPQIGPERWWKGGYTTWYAPLTGSDITSQRIIESLPEDNTVVAGGFVSGGKASCPYGYSQSLCYWGKLAVYQPQPDSCFGAGTGVWMADGSTKPIEEVRAGDVIRTTLGPRPVLLVEAPPRASRMLYQPGELHVAATASHPFRASLSSAVRRLAVAPWALGDAVPTMLSEGIGTLEGGAVLSGAAADGTREVRVTVINELPASGDAAEAVYDLIVGESNSPAYYVGGPEVFVEVDAETADPAFHVPTTAAIAVMMHALLPVVRQHPPADTIQLLRHAIGSVAVRDVIAAAGSAEALTSLPGVPGPDFFKLPDGAWNAQASVIESQLVRRFSRALRREAASGWRRKGAALPAGDVTVVFHDFDLIDSVVPADRPAAITVELCDTDVVQALPVAPAAVARGLVAVDAALNFAGLRNDAVFMATVSVGGQPIGRARIPSGTEGVEHFLFAPNGSIIGRIAIEQVRTAPASSAWTTSTATAMTAGLAQRIAARIIAAIPSPPGVN